MMYQNRFEKKMEQWNGLYQFNLAIEEENEYYLESMGGEDNLKKNCHYKSNNADRQGGQLRTIVPIHLWWCCYGRGTIIQLADGRHKRADEIQAGDWLICYGDKILKIASVIAGYQINLFRVQTDCGNSICVSKGHPMLLANGTGKAVETLTIGEELLMNGQTHAKVTSISCVEYNDTVYNLLFQDENDGNYLIANGFYSGDFYAQNKLEITLELPTEEQKQLEDEMANLMPQLNGEVR